MYGLVHRKDIFTSVVEAVENGLLAVPSGQMLVSKGDYIATNFDGDQTVVSREYVEAMKRIKIVTNPTDNVKPFVQEHTKEMLQEDGKINKDLMGSLYAEMGEINLNISDEAFNSENEIWSK